MDTTLNRLTHEELIGSLRSLVARSNEVEADIIEHIQEVESRGLHLDRAYPSLFAFCTAELGFSEGAAYNRIEVARAARRIPAVLLSLRRGEVHLTGLRLLSPHLTAANHEAVLLRAKGKSKRAIEEIVADLAPKPPVADSVRKLPERGAPTARAQVVPQGTPATPTPGPTPVPVQGDLLGAATGAAKVIASSPITSSATASSAATPPGEAQAPAARTYGIHFTASEALKGKLREAQDLLQHQVPGGDLAVIVEEALDLLIASVKKRRFGIGARPRSRTTTVVGRPSRHVPAEVRRQVYERDGGRCGFEDEHGRRCEETGGLELDHLDGFARTGEHDPSRMRMACRAHHGHAAEKMYGKEFMQRARARGRRGGGRDLEAEPGATEACEVEPGRAGDQLFPGRAHG